MKSLQFRSIAPKAPAVVPSPSPAVLPGQSPSSLPEATTASSPKSVIVPTQNYALMQIASQDGTFSLVALPPSVSSQTPQQQQQQTQSVQKNLKLPIPRYQPVRSKGSVLKVKPPSPATRTKATCSDVATSPVKPVSPTTKLVVNAVPPATEKKQESKCTETIVPKEEPTEQLILINPGSSDISVTALLPDNAVLYPSSQLEPATDQSEQPAQAGLIQNFHYPSSSMKTSPGKTSEDSKTATSLCQSKPTVAQPQSSITLLSPAIFSKAVQIIPSPPKGKLPIMPYLKMKSTIVPAAKVAANISSEKKGLSFQRGHTSPINTATNTMEPAKTLSHNQASNSALQTQAKTTILPVFGILQKPPGKKRGRKRKTMEDILAFEARKKRSLSFFRRRVPEKSPAVVSVSKQKEVDISKKYRSIRPKPILLMETVPQLVSLPAITSDGQEQELVLGHQFPTTPTTKSLDGPSQPASVALHLRAPSHPRMFVGSRLIHHCPTCSRCFQFKHHLQSHMNSHTNSRPYICLVCRKAYAHSGSLSTHMKLHHSEVRPRSRSLSCEFCEKSFGYVGVYFSHLREVHKVVLTVEPSISHHEVTVSPESDNAPEPSDEQDCEDPVELQIKCGRCQTVTPTFADMKMHLLHVHREKVHVKPPEGHQPSGCRQAEKELVKHAAHYWRQLNEKRNVVKCGSCDEEFFSFSKLKKHVKSHHCGKEDAGGTVSSSDRGGGLGVLAAGAAFNCVLCSKVMDTKEVLMDHWRCHHHCEQPDLLWDALSSFSGQEECEADGELDTPAPSPH